MTMVEEAKNPGLRKNLATSFKVILGLIFLILGVVAVLQWWDFLLMIIKGGIGLFLLLIGVITLAMAKE